MNATKSKYPEDELLVKRILEGDVTAFEQVVDGSKAIVRSITFKMIPNSADASDLFQDIYLKAYKNLGSFKFQCKLSTWVAQIAYNSCLNFLKKKRNLLIEYSENETVNYLEMSNTPDRYLELRELKEILTAEIKKLPAEYQAIFNLYYYDHLSYSEISQITDLPEGTLKSYVFRARKILRENISKVYYLNNL